MTCGVSNDFSMVTCFFVIHPIVNVLNFFTACPCTLLDANEDMHTVGLLSAAPDVSAWS